MLGKEPSPAPPQSQAVAGDDTRAWLPGRLAERDRVRVCLLPSATHQGGGREVRGVGEPELTPKLLHRNSLHSRPVQQ